MTSQEEIFEYAKNKYGVFPDYPWIRMPNCAILRHKHNRKWFGIIMDIPKNKLGLDSDKIVDVINVKTDPIMLGSLIDRIEIFPAWHMSREHWITILTTSSIPKGKVYSLIDLSYELTIKS